ncbi:MAG TPA: threonine synthase [bacterium]|jgi:threonine synthase|nr:threonine synthase [bacterium]
MRAHLWQGLIHRWKRYLPVSAKTPVISLHEGNTDLVDAPALAARIDAGGAKVELWLKIEGQNPTGSFKDRGMTLAVSKAAEEGSKAILCASTGNTSASAAAYAVRAGMKCVVLLPKGKIALGKLAQAMVHGATALAIEGNFDDALSMAREAASKYPITLVNSVNPYRLQGQKTAAFEIVEQLGDAPDFHSVPVGNAGNISAYWMGYREATKHGLSRTRPRMLGFQAAGAAPIVLGRPVKHPKTIATAIRIGNPASWELANAALRESRGRIEAVTDAAILKAYLFLTRHVGVFCEPASAASVAGVLRLSDSGWFRKQARAMGRRKLRIVCVLTGHGLKDPDRAIAMSPQPKVIQPNLAAFARALGW